MPGKDQELSDAQKTGILLLIGNTLLWPVYYISGRAGVAISVVVSATAIWGMHKTGEETNPVNKAKATVSTFFEEPDINKQLDRNMKQVTRGGAELFDAITHTTPEKRL